MPLKWLQKIRALANSLFFRTASVATLLFGFGGVYHCDHVRDGEIIGHYVAKNQVVDVGMNALLGIMFDSVTQITTWYIGLVDNASFSAFANSDTAASHSGWVESVAYSDSNRITWGAGTASARSITNATAATFNINATATIHGIFVLSNNTKGGTSGTLWSEAAFGSNVVVNSGDQLKVTYTVSG